MTLRPYPPVRVGIVGFGYWGPRLLRNFTNSGSTDPVAICESDAGRRVAAVTQHPNLRVVADVEEMLSIDDLELVAVATPVATHFDLARRALQAGKHVLVEKPFTQTVAQAQELLSLARDAGLRVAVDHTFLYTSVVRRLRKIVADGDLGDLLYYDSIRINLGLFQPDVNVIWDLAPHDLSILDYVLGRRPRAVSAIAASHTASGYSDVAYVTLDFGEGLLAHMHLNWLAPMKVRQVLIGGSRRMVRWDDIDPDEKIRLYDRGIECEPADSGTIGPDDPEGRYQTMISYRSGDMHSPWLPRTEALYTECNELGDAIRNDRSIDSDGLSGLRVVAMLEATGRSIELDGAFVPIDWTVLEGFE